MKPLRAGITVVVLMSDPYAKYAGDAWDINRRAHTIVASVSGASSKWIITAPGLTTVWG